jgi:predicted phage terminase large subunit-like protein
VYDNRKLLDRNPEYLSNLMALPTVDRERLLNGNWKIRPEAGKVFNRAWVDIVPFAPAGGIECRRWDFAATEKKIRKADPDFTAGVKIRRVNGEYYVLDCVADQMGPADVDRLFDETTKQDLAIVRESGSHYMVRWEIEPGSAGIRETARLVVKLAGVDAAGVHSSGDKLLRGKPLAQMAQAGHVHLVLGPWNEAWLSHMHNQPEISHNDIWDASAGAYRDVTLGVAERPDADAGEDAPGAGRERYQASGPAMRRGAALGSLRGQL